MSNDQQRRVIVKSNLFALRRQLELKTGRDWPWSQIAKAANLNPNTVYSLANDRLGGIQYETMGKLMDFFRSEGLEIQVGDLFEVVKA
jgi:hypothetical protein